MTFNKPDTLKELKYLILNYSKEIIKINKMVQSIFLVTISLLMVVIPAATLLKGDHVCTKQET